MQAAALEPSSLGLAVPWMSWIADHKTVATDFVTQASTEELCRVYGHILRARDPRPHGEEYLSGYGMNGMHGRARRHWRTILEYM